MGLYTVVMLIMCLDIGPKFKGAVLLVIHMFVKDQLVRAKGAQDAIFGWEAV
jgi:hypothetical protein